MRDSSFRRNTRLTSSAIRSALGGFGNSKWAKTSCICGTVIAGAFPPEPVSLQLQEPQGQQGQCHMVVPAHPRTYFIMIQPDFPLARAKQFLDAMPSAMDCHDHRQRNLRPGVRQRVPTTRLSIHGADDDQTLASANAAFLVLGLHPRLQRPDHFGSLGAGAQSNLAPARLRLGLSPRI